MFINILLIITAVVFVPYSIFILLYRKWFLKIVPFKPNQTLKPLTQFSIIIPARNESENIKACLESILLQTYPNHLFEIIVVDDYSTDETPNIINNLQEQYSNLQLIKLEDELHGKPLNAYKKKAIEIAISKSKGNYIVTTDADCIVQKNWLSNFDNYIQQNQSVFIAAPVVFTNDKSVLQQFQFIDFIALQATTAATVNAGLHSMCNGANLCYSKAVFNEVGGFKGIDNIASGDDMLLMNKVKQNYKSKIGYLFNQESIVSTKPMPTVNSFINQRIRWASKADKYGDKSLLPVLVMVYSFNVNIVLLFILGLFSLKALIGCVAFLLLKTIVEWAFMQPATHFFGHINFFLFMALQPLHVLYTVVAGWLGKFGTYSWKERKVK